MVITLDGIRDSMTTISGSDYMGALGIHGKSTRCTIKINYCPKNVGDFSWAGIDFHVETEYGDTLGYRRDHIAIPSSGGISILSHDRSSRVITGRFSVTGVNSYLNDTVRVKDGEFVVYYVAEGY